MSGPRDTVFAWIVCACASSVTLAGPPAPGPGAVSDGTASYSFDYDAFIDGEMNWTPNDFVGTDQAFQSWWWYRADNDLRETSFGEGLPATTEYIGNTARFTGTEANGLFWEMTWTVNGALGTLSATIEVQNDTSVPMVLNVFHYTDVDLADTTASDEATLQGPASFHIFDEAVSIEYTGEGADLWQVGAFPDLRTVLTDNNADDLNNSGLDFGPGDFSGAFQWQNRTLAPGQSLSFSATLDAIPSPGPAGLLALAGVGTARRRRSAWRHPLTRSYRHTVVS